MNVFQAAVLGLIQGLTEFLPVSSTAHLIIIPKFLGWEDPGLTFDVALHLGTLVALLLFFWQDWVNLIQSGIGYAQGKRGQQYDPLFWYIVLATIPGGIAGLLFEKKADRDLRDLRIIAAALVLLALVLVIAEFKGRKRKQIEQVSIADAIIVGCA